MDLNTSNGFINFYMQLLTSQLLLLPNKFRRKRFDCSPLIKYSKKLYLYKFIDVTFLIKGIYSLRLRV